MIVLYMHVAFYLASGGQYFSSYVRIWTVERSHSAFPCAVQDGLSKTEQRASKYCLPISVIVSFSPFFVAIILFCLKIFWFSKFFGRL